MAVNWFWLGANTQTRKRRPASWACRTNGSWKHWRSEHLGICLFKSVIKECYKCEQFNKHVTSLALHMSTRRSGPLRYDDKIGEQHLKSELPGTKGPEVTRKVPWNHGQSFHKIYACNIHPPVLIFGLLAKSTKWQPRKIKTSRAVFLSKKVYLEDQIISK